MLAAVAAAAAVTASHGSSPPRRYTESTTWRGLVGEAHPQVTIGRRRIVVLRTPSVAQRLAHARFATGQQERQWTAQAYAAQQQVLVELAAHGLGVRPDYSYARVLDGFSAALDPRAEALLERDPEVAGVYPVRAAFPASAGVSSAPAAPAAPGLAGFDGRGVTIALLDTGVDRAQPYLDGRVEPGVDVVGAGEAADAEASAQDPTRRERHGTELAGLLAGSGGPGGIRGAAPGATVFPIRVAGWQPDASGRDAVYARSDQLIAGLERAVDPNADGDAHDAARVALVGVAEPYAAFADSPEAQAVAGALALDTLVVCPAGNEGDAGPVFGSLDGPGGAAAALTVAALDTRPATASVRLVVWRGLETVFEARLPLLGGAEPRRALVLAAAAPRSGGEGTADYFDRRGLGLVAGKAALVRAGADPGADVVAAARAGAAAVLLTGGNLPAGSLGFSSDVGVPVVAVPGAAADAIAAGLRGGRAVGIALGRAHAEPNPLAGRIASFSSRGLAFSGILKPDLAAGGVALATADPGRAADGEPAFATVSGTSAAAAAVAGAAAVLAEARPGLGARDLASLLAGYARPAGEPLPAAGAGVLDVGGSVAGELAASATSLAFGGRSWRSLTLRNVSARPLVVQPRPDPELRVVPRRVALAPGRSARIRVRALGPHGSAGVLELGPVGGQPLRVPWSVLPRRPLGSLIRHAALADGAFAPSDASPAVLTVDLGRVTVHGGVQIEPVARLDVLLYTAAGTFVGRLARERDLLPGSYDFGITGRTPGGGRLAPGRYELRLVAWPTGGGAPSRSRVRFAIQSG
ncbi:MAG TPA: S8 family serine peptidase [Gaiellaceae bacterium]|nr:S8 family serine peptidase [Gaiellaceae bacterium]